MSQISTSLKMNVLAPSTLHVLLVEDNLIALHFIEAISSQAGIRFTSAMNGEQALNLVQSHHFDFIITDIDMPGISGFELADAIRKWEKDSLKKSMPIIGLTAVWSAEKNYSQSGINKMLSKPLNLSMLQDLMTQFFSINS